MTKNKRMLGELETILGAELFRTTLKVFAGKQIAFPKKYDHLNKDGRNRRIREDYENGIDVDTISENYKLSCSQVYKIIEKIP